MSNVPRLKEFSDLSAYADFSLFMEMRMENDANGNPIYVGYNKTPNVGQAVETWFIVKITYDANKSPTRQQLPDEGVGFKYAWSNRANIFS
jgi:hypothetical protein